MRFLLTILVVIIFNILNVQSQIQYVNFQPFTNSKCTGTSQGIGYSIQLDTCTTYDKNNTYIFTSSTNQVKWAQYSVSNVVDPVCSGSAKTTQTVSIGKCIQNTNIAFDDSSFPVYKYYYKVSVSNQPLVNSNSYIKSFMYNVGSCNENEVTNLQYFSNATKAVENSTQKPSSYYCSGSNEPYTYYCSIWGCGPTYTAANCQQINSTSPTLINNNNYYSVFCN
ncbi:hypothetical protein RB653_010366 [Dictyostelium firmibasis]|uniref:Uncharacterized protein n=1 Tax=Dictyostelium firmibasis TaxID=79012 RepID=A0AAN7TT01_9MYCE